MSNVATIVYERTCYEQTDLSERTRRWVMGHCCATFATGVCCVYVCYVVDPTVPLWMVVALSCFQLIAVQIIVYSLHSWWTDKRVLIQIIKIPHTVFQWLWITSVSWFRHLVSLSSPVSSKTMSNGRGTPHLMRDWFIQIYQIIPVRWMCCNSQTHQNAATKNCAIIVTPTLVVHVLCSPYIGYTNITHTVTYNTNHDVLFPFSIFASNLHYPPQPQPLLLQPPTT